MRTLEPGEMVRTEEAIFGTIHAPLKVVRTRKAYYCQDSASPSHIIEKGELCGSDAYGRVHYCQAHVIGESL